MTLKTFNAISAVSCTHYIVRKKSDPEFVDVFTVDYIKQSHNLFAAMLKKRSELIEKGAKVTLFNADGAYEITVHVTLPE